MRELSIVLRKLRDKRSLREISAISGISFSYIKSLEDDRHPSDHTTIEPTPSTLRKLSKAYNVPYGDLMKSAGYLDGIEITANGSKAEESQQLKHLKHQNEALKNCLKSLLDSY